MSAVAPTFTDEQQQALERMDAAAVEFATALAAASDSGLSKAVILPELIRSMRERGVLPADFKMPPMLGYLLAR